MSRRFGELILGVRASRRVGAAPDGGAAAPCFETHRSAVMLGAMPVPFHAAMLLSMRPREGS